MDDKDKLEKSKKVLICYLTMNEKDLHNLCIKKLNLCTVALKISERILKKREP